MLWSAQSVVQSGALWDRLPIWSMLCSAQSVMQSGALWNRLPRLRYVVVSTVSGTVGSIVGQIAKSKVGYG